MFSRVARSSVILLLVTVFLFGGCTTLLDGVAGITGIQDKAEARVSQAAMDAVGLGALEDSMIAAIVYSQVFFAGGYSYGYEDFHEGEGVTWNVTTTDEEGESGILRVERALLKTMPDGSSWWFLRYSAEGDEESFLSEALIAADYSLLKFRYLDPDTETVREWIPEMEEESAETEADVESEAEEPAEAVFYDGDFGEYNLGREKVDVPAGSFRAEHIKISDSYSMQNEEGEEETLEFSYEWWITDEVPGGLVKYNWFNESEGVSLDGELADTGSGYSTQLSSY